MKDYQDAFAALGDQEAQILVCDSAEETVQQALRSAVEDASSARMERIAVVGGDDESAAELVTHAAALNSERMVLVGPDVLDSAGNTLPASSPRRRWQGSSPPAGTRRCPSTERRSGAWEG